MSVRNFLFYRLGSLEQARDFTQEAFVRLWNNCAKVATEKARSFLFTTANRLFLDEADHRKVVLKFQQRSGVTESRMESNPEYLYRHREFKEQLEAAISSLPEKQRVVFLMSRIDKCPNKEIADMLDISVKAVEKHITSALKALKTSMDELDQYRI